MLCVDEKSQIQALDRTAPILPMRPGVPERATHDYKRHGTSSLYAALDITHRQGDRRAARAATARSSSRSSCRPSTARSPPISTSTSCSTTAPRTRRRRSSAGCSPTRASCLHFTPTSSSWLNLVERWFAELTTKKLRRGAHRSVRAAQRRHPRLDRDLERRPQALRLDQDRRPDPRIHRPLLHTNQRITTLGVNAQRFKLAARCSLLLRRASSAYHQFHARFSRRRIADFPGSRGRANCWPACAAGTDKVGRTSVFSA